MSRRIRHHVNPLALHHLETGAQLLRLHPGRPVEVELGCADASFLFERCSVDPRVSYVGVEIRRELVGRVNRQAQEAGTPQIRAVYANLRSDLLVLFGEAAVDRCHINFPDPCFKRSQKKRRFFTPSLARDLGRILKPGGLLSFQSDVFELALEALEILELASPPFGNTSGEWRFARGSPFGARSRRESWCEEHSIRIWRLRFIRM